MQESSPAETHSEGANWGRVGVLTGAHTIHDMSLGILGVLLPFIRDRLGFSLLLSGLLVPGQQAGSLLQPILGYWADRVGKRTFVVVFLTGTSVAMSLIGLSFSYTALFVLIVIGGFSSAAYHPAGSALVTNFAGDKWGTGLAIYHFGGNIGLAVGPLAAAWVVSEFGLGSTWLLAIPGIIWAGVVLRTIPADRSKSANPPPGRETVRWLSRHRKVFGGLSLIVFGRAIGAGGLGLFLPTLLLERGYSIGWVAALTSGFFAIGGFGGLASGWLSDRVGRHVVIRMTLTIAPIGLLLFLGLRGVWSIVFLMLASISLRSEQPVIMALIQEWAPKKRATVVGLVLGMQFVLSGLGTSMVGWLGDATSLTRAFQIVALTPLLGLPFVSRLPSGELAE